MSSPDLSVPKQSHPLLFIFYPSLTAAPEAWQRFDTRVRLRDYLKECGLDPQDKPITPEEVITRSVEAMAKAFAIEPPSLEEMWTMFERNFYLRTENFDQVYPTTTYLQKLEDTELSDGDAFVLPTTVIEMMIRAMIPAVVGVTL